MTRSARDRLVEQNCRRAELLTNRRLARKRA
jgi:hypothetical protein